jgi:hypothetical protein
MHNATASVCRSPGGAYGGFFARRITGRIAAFSEVNEADISDLVQEISV